MARPAPAFPAFACRQGLLVVLAALLLAMLALRGGPAQAAAPPKAHAHRIISLGPAITEMLFALGLGRQVVGRTSFCNYPAAALKVASVGALTGWNDELVVSLKPDLIFALEGDRAPVERLAQLTGARLAVLPTRQLADVWTNLDVIGRAAGVRPRAQALTARLKRDVAARAKRAAAGKQHPTAFYMVWDEPLMAASPRSYLGDLLTLAGGRNVVPANVPGSYPTFGWEALLAADPDVILAPRDRVTALANLPRRYPSLKAVRTRRLRTLPDDLISRPGPRVVQALDAVIQALK